MPCLKMILNPAADRGHAAEKGRHLQELLDQQIQASGAVGYEPSWVLTDYPHHATELAHAAVGQGFDVVVAVGGDGTVHEVINGLMLAEGPTKPLLGVIPIGSGNDFAHNFGLPGDSLAAISCLLGDVSRPVDVGLVIEASGRREYWDNTIGIGFSGAVNIATRSKKHWRGFMLYLVSVLETILFKPMALDATITFDSAAPVEHRISMLSLCNGPREGGGFPVAPDARMDDGQITYTIMRQMSRFNLLRLLPVVMKGQHMTHTRFFAGGVARHVRVETAQTMAIHIDGEVFGPWEAGIRQLEVSIIPGALRVLCSC